MADVPAINALWDYGHPVESERRFREALRLTYGEPTFRVELWTQVARAQGLQGQFEEAHRTLDDVEGRLAGAGARARVRYLLERGRVHNSLGEASLGKPLFKTAWAVARSSGEDDLAVDAAHMIAIVGPAEVAVMWNARALKLAEASKDPDARRWLGSLYNNIGWTHHDGGRYEAALATFEKAVAWRLQQGSAGPLRTARWSVARALRSLQRTEEALAMQQALLTELGEVGESDGYVHEELAECLALLGRDDEARPHFALAHELLSQDAWLVEHEPERLESLAERGGAER